MRVPHDPALAVGARRYHRRDGAEAMAELLDRGAAPDAVLCYNDLLAIGALHTLQARGLRVPDDVAVIGMDDIDDGRYSIPSLTTVAPDKAAIARHALELLLGRIGDRGRSAEQILLSHTVHVRQST